MPVGQLTPNTKTDRFSASISIYLMSLISKTVDCSTPEDMQWQSCYHQSVTWRTCDNTSNRKCDALLIWLKLLAWSHIQLRSLIHLQTWCWHVWYTPAQTVTLLPYALVLLLLLEIRSVERGICPIATSTINERTVPIIMAGCMAHEREAIFPLPV